MLLPPRYATKLQSPVVALAAQMSPASLRPRWVMATLHLPMIATVTMATLPLRHARTNSHSMTATLLAPLPLRRGRATSHSVTALLAPSPARCEVSLPCWPTPLLPRRERASSRSMRAASAAVSREAA